MSWPDRPVIFYDSTCGFCTRSVQWLLKRGVAQRFYFAPLHGITFQELVDQATASRLPDSFILWDRGKLLSRSRALVAVARRLPWPWKMGSALALIPPYVGDFIYDQVAKRRHRLVGEKIDCVLPTQEEAASFLP